MNRGNQRNDNEDGAAQANAEANAGSQPGSVYRWPRKSSHSLFPFSCPLWGGRGDHACRYTPITGEPSLALEKSLEKIRPCRWAAPVAASGFPTKGYTNARIALCRDGRNLISFQPSRRPSDPERGRLGGPRGESGISQPRFLSTRTQQTGNDRVRTVTAPVYLVVRL